MSASWIRKLNESDSRLHKEDVIKQALEACVRLQIFVVNIFDTMPLGRSTQNDIYGFRLTP